MPIPTTSVGLILGEALRNVSYVLPVLNDITLDLGDPRVIAQSKFMDTVRVRVHTVPGGRDMDLSTTPPDLGSTEYNLTLDRKREVPIRLTMDEAQKIVALDGSQSVKLLDEIIAPITERIALMLAESITGLWNHASFTAIVKTAAQQNYDAFVDYRTAFNTASIPQSGRFVTLNAAAYGNMLKDPIVTQNLKPVTGEGDTTQSGRVRELLGFKTSEHATLPADGNLIGFVGTKETTLLAVRPLADPSEMLPDAAGNWTMESISAGGFQMSLLSRINNLEPELRLCWLEGRSRGHTSFGRRIISAA